MRNMLLLLLLLLGGLTPQAVADKCVGEFSEPSALVPCSCTVYNRLQGGWSSDKVLSAYHAPSGHASAAQVAQVADVMAGLTECLPVWFMYSKADTIALGISHIEPVLTVKRGTQEVLFFERQFRKRSR